MELKQFNQAVNDLKKCIDAYIIKHNVKYERSLNAPSTYKTMRQIRDYRGFFLVYSGASESCILGSEYNIRFRAVHDHGHYKYGLRFTFAHEKTLSGIQAFELSLIAQELGMDNERCRNVLLVVDAEIRGQIEYYEKHKEYVTDQTKYCKQYLGVS